MSAAAMRLRARLDRKRDELLLALNALSKSGDSSLSDGIGENLFRLLGIVTFWSQLPDPSEATIADVNRALDMVKFVVVERGTVQ